MRYDVGKAVDLTDESVPGQIDTHNARILVESQCL